MTDDPLLARACNGLETWNKLSEADRNQVCNSIVDIAFKRRLSIAEISQLSESLAQSGSSSAMHFDTSPLFDFSSTGGGNSLTTILPPFLAASQGLFLPQLSVPGEVAGAIDTLGLIPDFKINLASFQIEEALRASHLAFSLNSEDLAPADLHLFNVRISRNAKKLEDLVIASLLSKKIATGVNNFLLDVRVGPNGNFGGTVQEAEANCNKLLKVSKKIGIHCTCVMTNHNVAPMPVFGRLESLSVLLSAANNEHLDQWTQHHVETCIEVAAYGVSALSGEDMLKTKIRIEKSIESGELRNEVGLSLSSQGSSMESLESTLARMKKEYRFRIRVNSRGFVREIKYTKIRDLFRETYEKECGEYLFCSPIGLKFLFREGDMVKKGDTILEVRMDQAQARKVANESKNLVSFGRMKGSIDTTRIYGAVRNE